jgi:hypothetical protein
MRQRCSLRASLCLGREDAMLARMLVPGLLIQPLLAATARGGEGEDTRRARFSGPAVAVPGIQTGGSFARVATLVGGGTTVVRAWEVFR